MVQVVVEEFLPSGENTLCRQDEIQVTIVVQIEPPLTPCERLDRRGSLRSPLQGVNAIDMPAEALFGSFATARGAHSLCGRPSTGFRFPVITVGRVGKPGWRLVGECQLSWSIPVKLMTYRFPGRRPDRGRPAGRKLNAGGLEMPAALVTSWKPLGPSLWNAGDLSPIPVRKRSTRPSASEVARRGPEACPLLCQPPSQRHVFQRPAPAQQQGIGTPAVPTTPEARTGQFDRAIGVERDDRAAKAARLGQ